MAGAQEDVVGGSSYSDGFNTPLEETLFANLDLESLFADLTSGNADVGSGTFLSEANLFQDVSAGLSPSLGFDPLQQVSQHNPLPNNAIVTDQSHQTGQSRYNPAQNQDGQLPQPAAFKASSTKPPPKIGARFSRVAVSILRKWLSAHAEHPYPDDKEKELLQLQTGLSKSQISNWLSNSRRRSMSRPQTRSASPYPTSSATRPMEIPTLNSASSRGRVQNLDPMERWFDSPPEHEGATVTAIVRAIASEPLRTQSPIAYNSAGTASDEPSLRSGFSGGSAGNSISSGNSLSSAYSHGSRRSSGEWNSMSRPVLRRNKRARRRHNNVTTTLTAPRNRYQCTFCAESFRTKYDWQRHENSLHLSLERWVCAPDGPQITNAEDGRQYCVFCGQVDPDSSHIQMHNPSSCQERTFSRKDHLKQHLRLVHDASLVGWLTTNWKIPMPPIRSRCGLCGISMDTWNLRIDHLADHFKMGQTMSNWKGDWGFEKTVLDMVENSLPPFLIEDERNTPAPFMASNAPVESPRHAYELIKSELAWFLQAHDHSAERTPNREAIQLEACRIVFAAEVTMSQDVLPTSAPSSWLRDLITSREDIALKARFGPMRSQTESALSIPRIYSSQSLFDGCPLERQLHDFAQTHLAATGLFPNDFELQTEACKIVTFVDRQSTVPEYNTVANWLIAIIGGSTSWLAGFRSRCHNSLAGHGPLAATLAGSGMSTVGIEPWRLTSDSGGMAQHPRHHGNAIAGVFDGNDSVSSHMNKALSSETQSPSYKGWLPMSPDHQSSQPSPTAGGDAASTLERAPFATITPPSGFNSESPQLDHADCTENHALSPEHERSCIKTSLYFLNDHNLYRWLGRELRRWVLATMSPNNPNCHIPSDEELQHQARCILYDDDDPWNLTAADNAEWLWRFKREMGIPHEPNPGFPTD
ncbi:hypothetical protein G7046_g3095 [Stylonectria norvegica]|nr:hypothetical protein G7046_g3095 [Stylonectria norvegica]